MAADAEHAGCAEDLLREGAKGCQDGLYPLFVAVDAEHAECAEALLREGAGCSFEAPLRGDDVANQDASARYS